MCSDLASAASLPTSDPGCPGRGARRPGLGVRFLTHARVRVLVARAVVAMLAAVAVLPGGQAWDRDRMAQAAERLGPLAVQGVQALHATLERGAQLDERARLDLVNQFFNRRILSGLDADLWGQNDYWASPLETLSKGAGDCEDYAIGKYFILMAAGVPGARLRLVYVRAQIGGPGGIVQAHMVLAYYAAPDAEPLILDNLITEVRPASRRPDLAPIFSFNAEGLWQGVGGGAPGGDAGARLSRWRDVLAKARAEGFL